MTSRHSSRRRLALAALLTTVGLAVAWAPAQPLPTRVPVPAAAAQAITEPLRLVVNVPAYRVDVYLHGRLDRSYPVTVGKPSEPTPIAHYQIERVIWNPWWHPPAHRRPRDKVTPPGRHNPMGRVKLLLRDVYFLHGTEKDREIGSAASRGCVRLRNDDALELAQLVHRHAGPDLPPGDLQRLVDEPRRTRHLTLRRPVPVELVYEVVELRDGSLHVHADPYRRLTLPLEEVAVQTLVASGYQAADVDREAVREAVAAGSPAPIPIQGLLRTATVASR